MDVSLLRRRLLTLIQETAEWTELFNRTITSLSTSSTLSFGDIKYFEEKIKILTDVSAEIVKAIANLYKEEAHLNVNIANNIALIIMNFADAFCDVQMTLNATIVQMIRRELQANNRNTISISNEIKQMTRKELQSNNGNIINISNELKQMIMHLCESSAKIGMDSSAIITQVLRKLANLPGMANVIATATMKGTTETFIELLTDLKVSLQNLITIVPQRNLQDQLQQSLTMCNNLIFNYCATSHIEAVSTMSMICELIEYICTCFNLEHGISMDIKDYFSTIYCNSLALMGCLTTTINDRFSLLDTYVMKTQYNITPNIINDLAAIITTSMSQLQQISCEIHTNLIPYHTWSLDTNYTLNNNLLGFVSTINRVALRQVNLNSYITTEILSILFLSGTISFSNDIKAILQCNNDLILSSLVDQKFYTKIATNVDFTISFPQKLDIKLEEILDISCINLLTVIFNENIKTQTSLSLLTNALIDFTSMARLISYATRNINDESEWPELYLKELHYLHSSQ